MRPEVLKEKSAEDVWNDLEGVITHFNDQFPDAGLRKELPLLIKDLQVIEYSNYLLQDT